MWVPLVKQAGIRIGRNEAVTQSKGETARQEDPSPTDHTWDKQQGKLVTNKRNEGTLIIKKKNKTKKARRNKSRFPKLQVLMRLGPRCRNALPQTPRRNNKHLGCPGRVDEDKRCSIKCLFCTYIINNGPGDSLLLSAVRLTRV